MKTRAKDTKDERPARGTRRKREISDHASQETVEQSSQAASQQTTRVPSSSPQPRRKKRVKRKSTREEESTVQTIGAEPSIESQEHAQQGEITGNGNISANAQEARSKHVRWSDIGVRRTELPSPPETQESATGLTTHVKRTSLSPSVEINKRPRVAKEEGRRVSLPPNLSQLSNGRNEIQFTPLRAVLDDRVKRRLRRSHLSEEINSIEEHKKDDARTRHELKQLKEEIQKKDERVKELMYEMEVQRQMSIDIDDEKADTAVVKEMEEELARLRKELVDHNAQALISPVTDTYDDVDGMDDAGFGSSVPEHDQMVLVEPRDLDMPDEPSSPPPQDLTIDTIRTTISLPDPTHEAEVKQFEHEIAMLTRETSDAKAALRILSIELQSMGFTAADASADEVLTCIRAAFRQTRVDLEELFPDDEPNRFENGALLEHLIEKLRMLRGDLDLSLEQVRQHVKMETTLVNQNNGLINKLGQLDTRNHILETQWNQLDAQSETKSKAMFELEEQLDEFETAVVDRDSIIAEQNATIESQDAEINDQSQSLDRLKLAVDKYREEVKGLESLISQMENDHAAKIEELEESHANELSAKQGELDAEVDGHNRTENDRYATGRELTKTKEKLSLAESHLETTRGELDELREEHTEEQNRRDVAESKLEGKEADIEDLEGQIDAAETSLADLRTQVDSLQSALESEQARREGAEAERDQRDTFITTLETQMRTTEEQATSLQTNITELKTQHESHIVELTQRTTDREAELEDEIGAEADRRTEAERTAADRGETIVQLKEEIVNLDIAVREGDQERHDLETRLDEAGRVHREDVAERDARLEAAERSMSDAEERIASLEATSADLLDQFRATVAEVADLRDTLLRREAEVDTQQERAEMAEISAEDKEDRIRVLENELVTSKSVTEELRMVIDTKEQNVESMSSTIRELKERVATEVDRGQNAVAQVLQSVRKGVEEAERVRDGLVTDGEKAVVETRSVVTETEMQEQTNGTTPSWGVGMGWLKKKVVKKNRRQLDSGIGVADAEMSDEEMTAGHQIAA